MLFADRRFDEIGAQFIDDLRVEDRRRGLRRIGTDRATELAEVRAIAELGTKRMTSDVIAIRGGRLALVRTVFSGRDDRPEAFHTVILRIAEIGADERIVAYVSFDPDDIDAAFEELDARYLAGEAAAFAHTWSLIARTFVALNRHQIDELPATTPGYKVVDHRLQTTIEADDLAALFRATWELTPDLHMYVEAVHRLNDRGAVITQGAHGTSHDGFDAQWRMIQLLTVEGDQGNHCEIFDEADIEAALARFDQLTHAAPQLDSAASQANERLWMCFAARDWAAIAELLADDFSIDDRRRVVNGGIRRGRDAEIANMQSIAEIGIVAIASTTIATRGQRVVLARHDFSVSDWPDAGRNVIYVVETNADNQVSAHVVFDPDDIDAAFEELDSRYLAGEAADYSHTWSVIARAYAAHNRRELAATTPDWVNIDHRHGTAFAPGDMTASIRAVWDLAPDLSTHVEAVHRLSNLGALVTHAAYGTSEGFEAEWRAIDLLTVEGDLINRLEVFDEADLDAALARFDRLARPTQRLENAASQVCERYRASFGARDWDAMTEMLADDVCVEDRRRVVNAGTRRGRDAEIANMRATADIGVTYMTAVVIATRGERLVLTRGDAGNDERAEAFNTEVLALAEIDADNRIAAMVSFDPDDIDAAFEELDARYLAGEAAAHAQAWSLIARTFVALNRHEIDDLPATTPDYRVVDHRLRATIEADDLTALFRATWDLTPDLHMYIESVHRLTDRGAVITQGAHGTSQGGFDAQWRMIQVLTVDGDMGDHCEIFHEADIDDAIARFDELTRPAPQLENEASRVLVRVWTDFAVQDWAALAEKMADDFTSHDHRRIVNAGVRRGRDVHMANMRAVADVGFENLASTVLATRGQRLVLSRTRAAVRGLPPEEVGAESIMIVEIDADDRLAANDLFDLDDIDAAFEELDARYLAGEAAAHAHTWSVIAGSFDAVNRHELPKLTPDWVNIDHRRAVAFALGDMTAYIRATLDDTPDFRVYIEAVHRLSDLGMVVTWVSNGTSQAGFQAEWRLINISTVEGDLINRSEMFDEADLDAALARFDELSRPAPRLENAASRVYERMLTCFTARDWDGMANAMAADTFRDDRRRVVSGEANRGREAAVAEAQAVADLGAKHAAMTVVAIRGQRLALIRSRFSNGDPRPEAFHVDSLTVVEIDGDDRVAAHIMFDPDDREAAIAELDARYLAGEAAAHAHTWSVITSGHAALNRRELPPATPDCVSIDHRRGASFAPGELVAYLDAGIDLGQSIRTYIEVVHRLSDLGAVYTHAGQGVSQEGFDAEWRGIDLVTVEGDMVNRCEVFDELDIDAALARFEQLSPTAPRLENAATRTYERIRTHFLARDWDALAEALADNHCGDDRRRVVNSGIRLGREAEIASMQATADVGVASLTSDTIATRGDRLALCCIRGATSSPEAFHAELLRIVEIDADGRVVARVVFDLDDFEAAITELDARYLAGEAAAHAHTWSVLAGALGALNRHEVPATTTDFVDIDHRRVANIDAGGMKALLRTALEVTPVFSSYVEKVHRLSDLGAVATQVAHGTSQEGFDAEWRTLQLLTVEGDLINRCEVFDETDLDAALARFDNLTRPAPQLENAASRVRRPLQDLLRGARLGRDGGDTGRRLLHRRSPSGREYRDPKRSRCRDREHAGRCRDRCQGLHVCRHCDPREPSCSQSYPRLRPGSGPRGLSHRGARRRGDQRRQPDHGTSCVRPR